MLKAWLQRFARKYGYEVRKAPFAGFQPVSVFDLAMRYLIATRGNELTFIEVGANDGKSTDPLREYIVDHGWKGLLIEPQPDVFERLRENYAGLDANLIFENVAISSTPGAIPLYRLPKAVSNIGAATQVSANQKITAKQLGVSSSALEKIMVPTARLDDMAAKHGLTDVDVLQLDTEGYDWDVLQTLDLTRTSPLLIGFEHGHLPAKKIGAMVQHLNMHGYAVHFGGYETDSLALRKDFIKM